MKRCKSTTSKLDILSQVPMVAISIIPKASPGSLGRAQCLREAHGCGYISASLKQTGIKKTNFLQVMNSKEHGGNRVLFLN